MKTILVDAIDGLVFEDGTIFEGMHKLLETYPNRKVILTGVNDEQYQQFGLSKVPYELFTLKHDPEKTDPQYFAKMLEYFNLSKDEVIYFEHNPEAAHTAESVGIKTFFYDHDKKDLVALKQFIDDNL